MATARRSASGAQGYRPAIGERVSINKKPATCRFLGPTEFAEGEWIGLELEEPVGKNNGVVEGHRYFECKPLHGIFSRQALVEKFDPAAAVRQPSPRSREGRGQPAPGKSSKEGPMASSPPAGEPKQQQQVGQQASLPAASSPRVGPDVAALRRELAEAVEEHDSPRLSELLPQAERCGISPAELENAQRVLNFQVQNLLLQEVKDVQAVVAELAETVAKVEARATELERTVASPFVPQGEKEKEGKEVPAPGPFMDSALMDEWLAEFASQLQTRVWEVQERKVTEALERAMGKAMQELSALAAAAESIAEPLGMAKSNAHPKNGGSEATVEARQGGGETRRQREAFGASPAAALDSPGGRELPPCLAPTKGREDPEEVPGCKASPVQPALGIEGNLLATVAMSMPSLLL